MGSVSLILRRVSASRLFLTRMYKLSNNGIISNFASVPTSSSLSFVRSLIFQRSLNIRSPLSSFLSAYERFPFTVRFAICHWSFSIRISSLSNIHVTSSCAHPSPHTNSSHQACEDHQHKNTKLSGGLSAFWRIQRVLHRQFNCFTFRFECK